VPAACLWRSATPANGDIKDQNIIVSSGALRLVDSAPVGRIEQGTGPTHTVSGSAFCLKFPPVITMLCFQWHRSAIAPVNRVPSLASVASCFWSVAMLTARAASAWT
jgi:hypothetical protein